MRTDGLPLREVLRRRRELPLEEVLRLVKKLPELPDTADGMGAWINELLVQWETCTGAEAGDWAGRSVREWPPFLLRWRTRVENQEREDSGATLATILPPAAGTAPAPPAQLALLIYELLGGSRRAWGDRTLSPLAALDEEGNTVLRRATRGEFADIAGFLRVWELAVAEQLSAAGNGLSSQTWQVPRWVRHTAQSGKALQLEPAAGGLPVHLVARPQFRIGRSRGQSDLPIRIWTEEGHEDVEASAQISRLHVLAELTPDGPVLRDGNGAQPSANGSSFNGVPLSASHPTLIECSGELTLGGSASLELLTIPRTALSELEIPGSERVDVPPGGTESRPAFGAIAARVLTARVALLRDAVWLFSELGGEIGASGALRWVAGSAAHFAFLRRHESFWMVNVRCQSGEVRLDDAILTPGQIAPLTTGQVLDLGTARFNVAIL
jgi:hypothetical protein